MYLIWKSLNCSVCTACWMQQTTLEMLNPTSKQYYYYTQQDILTKALNGLFFVDIIYVHELTQPNK